MIFSYNWLQSFFTKKLPAPEKLAEILTTHSFEVEETHPVKSGEAGAPSRVAQFNRVKKFEKDFILDIDVLPNRGADCFSYFGVARECSVLTNLKIKEQKSKIIEDKRIRAGDFIKIEAKDKKSCPRYTARVVSNVKVGPSPKWLKEKLEICGLQPINNVVDIANYVMLETGQPLHTFDARKIEGKKIIVRKARKGEKISALDNKTYNLDKDTLVITDLKGPLAIAGIKGGKKAEIDKKTKEIIIESANFDPLTIAKTSRKLNLKTDASLRFENGIDPNLTQIAADKTAILVKEIAGGNIAKGLIDFYPKKVSPKTIKLDLDYVDRLIGIKISKEEIKNIFKKLGFKTKEIKNKVFEVEVPTFRLDISLPENLIEEIVRVHGYQKIPSTYPRATLIPPKRNLDIFWEDIAKNILKEAGFSEVLNYSFISKKEKDVFGFKNLLELENPLSSDFQYLRPSLIPNLLKNVAENQRFLQTSRSTPCNCPTIKKEIKIFELGKIFRVGQNREKKMLNCLMTGDSFFEAKGVLDLFITKLGISEVWYDEYKPTPEASVISIWLPKKCAEIKVGDEEIGFLGEISPRILGKLKITGKVVIFDLDFEKLLKLASEEHEFRPISAYPAAIRDIAILVPRKALVEEVLNKIETVGGKLIRDVDLFDIYEGEELPDNKKNLAFHIIYQAEDRTLSSGEIDKIHKKIIKALEEDPEWEVRK
jgi:phenylalanyl-tRNA synthetase beta chain